MGMGRSCRPDRSGGAIAEHGHHARRSQARTGRVGEVVRPPAELGIRHDAEALRLADADGPVCVAPAPVEQGPATGVDAACGVWGRLCQG